MFFTRWSLRLGIPLGLSAIAYAPELKTFVVVSCAALALVAVSALSRHATHNRLLTTQIKFNLMTLAVTVTVSLFLTEGILRTVFRRQFKVIERERSLQYQYDPELGWCPVPNLTHQFLNARKVSVANNSLGFRGPEFQITSKPTVAFVGDSYVWGYDVEVNERFTEKLQARHPEWTLYNLGVAGYGTDQEYLILQRYLNRLPFRAVFLVFCELNDRSDNSSNFSNGWTKPYYRTNTAGLGLCGVPAPMTETLFRIRHPVLYHAYVVRLLVRSALHWFGAQPLDIPDPTEAIIADMNRFLQTRGVPLAVGLENRDRKLERFLTSQQIPWVDLYTPHRYAMLDHWTPEGHDFVCQQIDNFLATNNVFRQALAAGTNRSISAGAVK